MFMITFMDVHDNVHGNIKLPLNQFRFNVWFMAIFMVTFMVVHGNIEHYH